MFCASFAYNFSIGPQQAPRTTVAWLVVGCVSTLPGTMIRVCCKGERRSTLGRVCSVLLEPGSRAHCLIPETRDFQLLVLGAAYAPVDDSWSLRPTDR